MKLPKLSDAELDQTGNPKLARFAESYRLMWTIAKYRPQAPGDGFGHIDLSRQQLADQARLHRESVDYAIGFSKQEDTDSFMIGCSDFSTNRAFVWAIEAARVLAAGTQSNSFALKLLEMAAQEVKDELAAQRKRRR
jgi:hypothetical protein